MKRPKHLKVLDLDYSIEWTDQEWSNQTGSHGQHSYPDQKIRIQKTRPQVEANTFLHETLHACADAMSLDDNSTEEDFVSRLTTALITTWRDNPKAFAWWQYSLKH